ncbi:MAG: molybdopterin-dependent oxidoreductase [Blastocatellia bacterium]|nr:molybdopterin-dependent oxidoreductase [Blastocatellia bacterium]
MPLFDSNKELEAGNRRMTRRVFVGFIGAGIVGLVGRHYYKQIDKAPSGIKSPFLTQIGDFYSINFSEKLPALKAEEWRLTLSGPEGKSLVLTLDELKKLPAKTIYKTFECIENEVGGDAIGNAEWRVTPLLPLLEKIAPADVAALRVVFRAHDDYYTSSRATDVFDQESYLAYEMNGQPLPRLHGFPVRVFLPGKYGYKQPKWIKEIQVTAENVVGYWEAKGWSDAGEVKPMSRIDTAAFETSAVDAVITGVAYAGRHAVGTVELSLDRGATWQTAEIASPTGKNHWSVWRYVWRDAPKGHHKLIVRLRDAAGNLQTETRTGHYPAGASGWHRVDVVL